MTLPPFRPAAGTGNPPAPSAPLRRDERDAAEALNQAHGERVLRLLPPSTRPSPIDTAGRVAVRDHEAASLPEREAIRARSRAADMTEVTWVWDVENPRRPSLAERLAVTRAAGRRP